MKTLLIFFFLAPNIMGKSSDKINSKDTTSVQVCDIQFNPVGSIARFRGSIIFKIKTPEEEEGHIQFLEINYKDNFEKLVNIESLKECLKKWTLQSNMVYTIKLAIGTTLDPTIYTICDQSQSCLKFIIPK